MRDGYFAGEKALGEGDNGFRLVALLVVAAVAVPLVARADDGSARRRFPLGVTTRTFTKTSVTTGAPRPLATVIWYPAVRATGTPEAQGLRDATVRRRRLRYALPFFRRYLTSRRSAPRALVRSVSGVELSAEPRRHSGDAP
jgi:hypothetical protein